jgi:RNA polymerase sigma factor (sigma-70 family)
MDLDAALDRARAGDFAPLVRAAHVPVRALLHALLRDPHDADDLAQQTFLYAFEHLRELRADSHPLAWLKAVARNLAADFLKRRAQRRLSRERFLRAETARRAADLAGLEALESRLDGLQSCVERLPEVQRDFLRRAHDRTSTLEALARELGRPAAAVRKQVSRLYALLRDCIDRRLGGAAP